MSENESQDEHEHKQFEQYGGITEIDLKIRIPSSFYEGVKQYCKIASISPREFFNHAIIDEISALQIGILNVEFTKKYHLQELSPEDRESMIHLQWSFTLKEEKLKI